MEREEKIGCVRNVEMGRWKTLTILYLDANMWRKEGLTGEGSDSNLPARETIRAGSVGSSHGRAQNHNDNMSSSPNPGPTPSHN